MVMKRLAAVTALALGLAPGLAAMTAPPAFAAKPEVTTPTCAISGTTLYVLENAADIAVSTDGTSLYVSDGTGPCSDPSTFDFGDFDAADIESDGGSVVFDLEDAMRPDRLGDFDDIPYTVAADVLVALQAGGIHDSREDVRVDVRDTTFDAGTLAGDLFTARLVFDGGDGSDVFDASRVTDFPVIADGGDGDDLLRGGRDNDTLTGGYDDDAVYGGDGNDDVAGDAGNDQVYGGDGNDDLEYADGAGTDVLFPGDGDDDIWNDHGDTISYADSSDPVQVDLRESLEVRSRAGDDDLDTTPSRIIGSPYDDEMQGDAEGNRFEGGSGDDALYGGRGDDLLFGGTGDDDLRGGIGMDYVVGEAGSDTLAAGPGNDTILGGPGNDVMYGRLGNDTLRGGDGIDTAYADGGTDACIAETKVACELG